MSDWRARALIDLLICQRCGGFIGDGPEDRDVSCVCRRPGHARWVRAEAEKMIRRHKGPT